MPAKFCIQNIYKSLSKCGIHFVYKHFVYILYAKVCRNVGYILYTNILYTLRLLKCGIDFVYKHSVYIFYTFCMQIVCKRLLKCGIHLLYKHSVYILYTFCIQNIYKRLLKCGIHFVYVQTFYIHCVYISSGLQKVYIISMSTICIQNPYRM